MFCRLVRLESTVARLNVYLFVTAALTRSQCHELNPILIKRSRFGFWLYTACYVYFTESQLHRMTMGTCLAVSAWRRFVLACCFAACVNPRSPITLLWSCYSLAGHPLQHLAFQGYRLEEVRHPLTSSCVLSISSLHSFSLFSHPYCGLLSIKSYGLCLRYPINGESNKCQLRLRLDSHIPSIMRLWSPSPILS